MRLARQVGAVLERGGRNLGQRKRRERKEHQGCTFHSPIATANIAAAITIARRI